MLAHLLQNWLSFPVYTLHRENPTILPQTNSSFHINFSLVMCLSGINHYPLYSVHRFNQHLTGPYYTQLFHKAQPTHSYMAQMLVIMDVRYDISTICMRYVAYSLWKVRCEVKVVCDLAIGTSVGYVKYIAYTTYTPITTL